MNSIEVSCNDSKGCRVHQVRFPGSPEIRSLNLESLNTAWSILQNAGPRTRLIRLVRDRGGRRFESSRPTNPFNNLSAEWALPTGSVRCTTHLIWAAGVGPIEPRPAFTDTPSPAQLSPEPCHCRRWNRPGGAHPTRTRLGRFDPSRSRAANSGAMETPLVRYCCPPRFSTTGSVSRRPEFTLRFSIE